MQPLTLRIVEKGLASDHVRPKYAHARMEAAVERALLTAPDIESILKNPSTSCPLSSPSVRPVASRRSLVSSWWATSKVLPSKLTLRHLRYQAPLVCLPAVSCDGRVITVALFESSGAFGKA